jgi:16S rRNA (uracil1498-N3)-methyltransferase
MDRFYLSPDQWGESPVLTGDEAHHCCRVMRKQVGDEIAIFDGWGRAGGARIKGVSKSEVGLEILVSSDSVARQPQIEIAVGVPKGKTFDLILQKAVELGVTKIQPLITEQGNVRLKGGEANTKREKWKRTVLESCKQCGQNYLPEVMGPLEVDDYLKGLDPSFSKFVGALTPEAVTFRRALGGVREPGRVVLLVGPEGDFSPEEYNRIFVAGFQAVTLGELVLRTETAVFWMASAVRYHFES